MTTQTAPPASKPTLTVTVRDRAPTLPKIAFVFLGIASLLGTALSNRGLGVPTVWLAPRWLALWATAATVGLLAWRTLYLRDEDDPSLADYHADLRSRARLLGRGLGLLVLPTVPVVAAAGYLAARPGVRAVLAVGAVLLAALLLVGVDHRARGWGALVVAAGLTGTWAVADAGGGVAALLRGLHLAAFGLWVGGATWNLGVAIPVGTRHPTLEAVSSGALQLQRFRRVARVALPTIVATGVVMALPYLTMVGDLGATTPGILIAAKLGLIVALVVIFITCPLFRQCSPVAGVCDLDELDPLEGDRPGAGA